MKTTVIIFIFGVSSIICEEIEDHALFYKRSDDNIEKDEGSTKEREISEKRIENLLIWLQNKYKEKSRKAREDLNRGYLPSYVSSTTQVPRPFQTSYGERIEPNPSVTPADKGTTIDELAGYKPDLTSFNDGIQSKYDSIYPEQNMQNILPTQEANTLDTSSQLHPPHIHNINAECSKDQMIVNIEFNTPFNGLIYSKGHYNSNECRYVAPNSGKSSYRFTLLLNSCGTQFIDRFSEGQQAYLENIIVVQNEPGILEAWDSIHAVRCLWEGKITQSLSSGINIGSLEQKLVTFNGDTGKARLEIQVGRGPFSYAGQSLVQLGDLMTLVITVDGDPQFNLKIGQCISSSSAGSKIILTDSDGCPLKEKLMGAFQFTRNPQDGAPIAFAFFKAFKFPEEMDINFECQVELCKVECSTCQKPDLKYEPTRRKRFAVNSRYIEDGINGMQSISVNSTIRIFSPDDILVNRQ